jgi:putative ABC transport system ATP-binding protein
MTALDVDALTVEYRTGSQTSRPVRDLSLHAESGELVLLLGPSGCGKTTLLSVLAGILAPSAGRVRVDGRLVTGLSGPALTRYRRHVVGLVFQSFNLVPSLSAVENVAAPLWAAGWRGRAARDRATELLEQFHLEDFLRSKPGRLSGGQQQRVAIARALVHDPPLLLADEPTAHLDQVQVEGVVRILRQLAAPGRLVVVSTHDERLVPLADQVVRMSPRPVDLAAPPAQVSFGANTLIFAEGDPASVVYVIEKGGVRITRATPDGEQVLARLGRGEYFGELGPMLGVPRAASARAVGSTVLTGYSVRDFRALLRSGQLAAPAREGRALVSSGARSG